MKKILFLTPSYYPHVGGVEKHVYEISKILVKKKYKVTILTERPDSTKEQEIREKIHIHRIHTGKVNRTKKFRIWQALWRKRALIKEADIIHCHDIFFWYLPFRFLYPAKKVFTTFHGYESYPLPLKNIVHRKIVEWLSDGNICIGDFIQKWYFTKPTYIAYGGVAHTKNISVVRKPSALFLGRLDGQTAITTYVEAVKQIKKRIQSFSFTIAGDGPLRDKIEKQFSVQGFIHNGEILFSKSRYAFVSRNLSIMEAMARKRLVFAIYDNPLKKDYLSMMAYAPYIVIVGSAKELVKKLLYFFAHPQEEYALVEAGYKWVKKQTWEATTNTYLQLWQEKTK